MSFSTNKQEKTNKQMFPIVSKNTHNDDFAELTALWYKALAERDLMKKRMRDALEISTLLKIAINDRNNTNHEAFAQYVSELNARLQTVLSFSTGALIEKFDVA